MSKNLRYACRVYQVFNIRRINTHYNLVIQSIKSSIVFKLIPPLLPDKLLHLSQVYFALPRDMLWQPLLAADMAARALQAGMALARSTLLPRSMLRQPLSAVDMTALGAQAT